ncbi:hypothetical protein ACOMHN_028747 [Nucella lapillus]
MSVYLPKIENYPLFDLGQLDTRDATPRTQRKKALFPLAPPIDQTPDNALPSLPDIRVTDTHAQPLNLTRAADDRFAKPQDESVAKETHEKKVTFGPGDVREGADSGEEGEVQTASPRDRRSWARRKLGTAHSAGRVARRLDSHSCGQPPEYVPCETPRTPGQIRRKFSQAIKAVMTIRRLAAIMIKKSEEPSAMLQTFTSATHPAHNFSENLRNQGLSFDPSYFKANKEISVSNEVKTILNLPPSSRSQEQIQTAMYGLQSLPSFAEYPLHMQEKLTKVAWYERVSPKRTIIRQGHYAENFYFILSGQAVVTLTIYDPKTKEPLPRTANFMRKGTSFGELALLHHSRRTATVTSHDTVQLLSIGREDFFDIFMSRQGNDDIPQHIKFVSQLDFMKGWPIERLLEHPEHCLLHFFKRNMVIVNDSKQSDWLYIVKSGSCQVLKQLRGVTARLGMRKQEDDRPPLPLPLPHSGTSIGGPKVDTGLIRLRPKSHRSLAESSDCGEEGETAVILTRDVHWLQGETAVMLNRRASVADMFIGCREKRRSC